MAFVSDETVGRNLAKLRGDVSMDVLAAKMRDSGNKWTKTTVFNVEHGKRQLKYAEAVDVLNCLGYDPVTSLGRLLANSVDAELEHMVQSVLETIRGITYDCALLNGKYVCLDNALYADESETSDILSSRTREKAQAVIDFIDNGSCLEMFQMNIERGKYPRALNGEPIDDAGDWWLMKCVMRSDD